MSSDLKTYSQSDNQFCTFYIDGTFFGVDVLRVQEIVRFHSLTVIPRSANEVKGLINLRGQIVMAIDTKHCLGLNGYSAHEQPINLIVYDENREPMSLLVDEIGDVIELSSRALEEVPDTVDDKTKELVSGVYKLKDKFMLVFDIDRLSEGLLEYHDKMRGQYEESI